MLPAERSRVNSRALHSPAGTVALGYWELLFRIPPASYGTHGEELWEASTNINQRDSRVPGPSLARTPADVMEPGEMGQVGHTWGCSFLEGLGKGHSGTCPTQSHWCWPQLLPTALLCTSTAPCASSSGSAHRHHRYQTTALTPLVSHPQGKATGQSHSAPPACTRQPPWSRKPSCYLFKCSSRKRKVMRLGSGSERRRCIMQFSLAAGSERAGDKEGEGSGQGLVTSCAAVGPTVARCLLAAST